ncbi:5'-nucleotidase [Choiromyces venosus 120613-1]|uniref:5'-nucleotidase n=1 Tax=Choiromyces venosus 120613-1 TaxID=1336337 RepID=A0A3N4JW50_9PEZI|nr:5'-nucleotidase [Choiromyces venosus 120613-1]
MKLLLKALLTLGLAAAGAVARVDTLYSERLSKRSFDHNDNYNVTLLHVNDVHAHLDQFSPDGTDCLDPSKGCVLGGYARIKHVVDTKRKEVPDALLLNAGDEFQGTLFYSYYKSEKIAETLNQLGFDAMALGNHEFDDGNEEVVQFINKLNFPVTACNIRTNDTGLQQALVPYVIFPEHKLAVVAVTTPSTADSSSPDAGTTFDHPISAIQNTVNVIQEVEDIKRIIALTHIGYAEDIELAQKTRGIHMIIGGHSHTLLGDMPGAKGKYPTIQKNLDGEEVFIVTSYRWGEYIGSITITYDPSGRILSYAGEPIKLTDAIHQHVDLQDQITKWRAPFEKFSREVVGRTEETLSLDPCLTEECTLGNLVSDAMLESCISHTPDLAGAILNGGGIRAGFGKGQINRGQILTAFPFGNALVEINLTGRQLWDAVEGIVSGVNLKNGKKIPNFLQVSNEIRFSYNPGNSVGSRLVSLEFSGRRAEMERVYKIVTLDFLADGGDSYFEKQAGVIKHERIEDAIIRFIKAKSPLNIKIEGRSATTTETRPRTG